jgi:hypothetical protein
MPFIRVLSLALIGGRTVMRLTYILCIIVGLAASGRTSAAPHPFHDDGGTVNWKWSLPAAQAAAQRTGKPILIEACREACGLCRHMAATSLKDAKISQMINRHFIPYVVDVDNTPPALRALYGKVPGQTLPFILFVTDKGEFIQASSGVRTPEQFRGDLEKVLENKAFLLPKKSEPELAKQTDVLAKLLDDKSYSKLPTTLVAIGKLKGYHALKDKIYDLLDTAQAEAAKKVNEAVELAEQNEYSKAREALRGIAKEYAGLPIADQIKDQLAALKLLETAQQTVTGKKGQWKALAVQQLTQVVALYGDTPLATLAVKRNKELQKSN